MEYKLWYRSPSRKWEEGLPIGNGRLAAMAVSEENRDRFQLNHEWLWRGVWKNRDNEYVADRLPQVREALKREDFLKATEFTNRYFAGRGGIAPEKGRVDAYQTAGEFIFAPENAHLLERSLNLETAVFSDCRSLVATVEGKSAESREGEGALLQCRAAVSCSDNFLMIEYRGEKARFSGKLSYVRVEDAGASCHTDYEPGRIRFACAFDGGQSYRVEAVYFTDGQVMVEDDGIRIAEASYLQLFANIGVEVKKIEEELARYPLPAVQEAAETDTLKSRMDTLFARQEKQFGEMMNRSKLRLAPEQETASQAAAELPTDTRIARFRQGQEDNGLLELYYNYGKYLLVCSSICGELPANLQGKWNDLIAPPWDCDYHFDINLEMNYWASEQVGMGECANALLNLCEHFVPHAKKAAHDLYGCRGIYFPIQTDCWGRSTPESYGWAAWLGAAAWIAWHFWDHYRYGRDEGFLRERAYPFFKEIAAFYEDYLVEDENGICQIMPSQSPENRFAGTGDFPVSIGISSAMDVELCYEAFGYAIRSAELLGVDEDRVKVWKELRARLPEFKIGSDGRLLEWDREMEEVEPGHRHFSHLYGLYPGELFTREERPRQYEAAKKSLEYRLSQGGGHTGWSRAWTACLQARLGEPEKFYEHFSALVKDFATDTLLDLCGDIFQIDGNLGAVAALNEALFGCCGGKVHLLGALPQVWRKGGSVENVKLPGGHTLSFSWKDGMVENLRFTKACDEPVCLVYNGKEEIR